MYNFSADIQIGDYAISLGVMISVILGMMVHYDNNHNIYIYKDHLHVKFSTLGTDERIEMSSIQEIITSNKECQFSNIILKTKDNKRYIFYFIDFPLKTKALIESHINEVEDLFSNAA